MNVFFRGQYGYITIPAFEYMEGGGLRVTIFYLAGRIDRPPVVSIRANIVSAHTCHW
jgi:hypothetical protein